MTIVVLMVLQVPTGGVISLKKTGISVTRKGFEKFRNKRTKCAGPICQTTPAPPPSIVSMLIRFPKNDF